MSPDSELRKPARVWAATILLTTASVGSPLFLWIATESPARPVAAVGIVLAAAVKNAQSVLSDAPVRPEIVRVIDPQHGFNIAAFCGQGFLPRRTLRLYAQRPLRLHA